MIERIDPDRLADRIRASGLSHTKVAKAAGLHQPAISRILAGEQRGTRRIHVLAKVLNTTPEYLEGKVADPSEGADLSERLSSEEREWVALYEGLTPEQRKLLRALARDLRRGNSPSTYIHDQRNDYGAPDQA